MIDAIFLNIINYKISMNEISRNYILLNFVDNSLIYFMKYKFLFNYIVYDSFIDNMQKIFVLKYIWIYYIQNKKNIAEKNIY